MASPGSKKEHFDLASARDILSRTPTVLKWFLAGLTDDIARGGTEDDWAPFDILGHLIHGEVTDWIPRARIILAQGNDRTFEPFDRLAQFELSNGKSIDQLLKEFHKYRHESLETLISWDLSNEQLALTGIHPKLGKVTLSELIASWVAHDMTHIRQIATCIAKKFGPHVGPWREYLSIID